MKRENNLITFSGADCCGKSTQISLLKNYLDQNNVKYETVWTRGGHTPGIEFLKSIVRRGKKMSDQEKIADSQRIHQNPHKSNFLLGLSIIDICLFYGVVIRIKLMKNTVICDRYMWDALIDFIIKYPSVNIEKTLTWRFFSKICKKPDVSFAFSVSPEEALRRGELKKERNAENLEQRIYKNGLYRQKADENRWMYVIDSEKPKEEIHGEILRALSVK